MAQPVALALTGDVMLGRLVDDVMRRRGPAYPWGNAIHLLRDADLAIVNLECVIAQSGRRWTRWAKAFHFRAAPQAISALKLAGVDCVVLANNHVLDYEEPALLEMLARLGEAGIAFAGAGGNLEQARAPALLDVPDLRVGVVAFTDNEPLWAATATRPGTHWIDVSLEPSSLGPVRESLQKARDAGADVVVFSMHWGPNMVERPPEHFRQFAHAVLDEGADLFYGHSAHVFQGIEIYRGRPILYDTGDFVDDYAVDPTLRNDRSLLFRAVIEDSQITRIELLPMVISACQVNVAQDDHRMAIAARICQLSAEFGTDVRAQDDLLVVSCGHVYASQTIP